MDNCQNGHDKDIVGRYAFNRCKICVKATSKRFRKNHADQIQKEKQEYYNINKEKFQLKNSIYRNIHKKELAESKREYYMVHRDAIIRRTHKYYNTKYKEDINFKLSSRLRHRIRQAIKNNQKVGSAVDDLGCSIEFLKNYIEDKFYLGMSWDNYGKIWELDHIKRLADFDLTNSIQFKQAVHYTNLQPLTVEDHRKKTTAQLSSR